MKVFYKEHESKKVYVQVGDLIALANINAAIMPSTVKAKTLDSIDCDEKEFVGFEAPEEIAFFESIDWIIDYKKANQQSEEEIKAHIKLLREEMKKMVYNKELDHEYEKARHQKQQYNEILDIKRKRKILVRNSDNNMAKSTDITRKEPVYTIIEMPVPQKLSFFEKCKQKVMDKIR